MVTQTDPSREIFISMLAVIRKKPSLPSTITKMAPMFQHLGVQLTTFPPCRNSRIRVVIG